MNKLFFLKRVEAYFDFKAGINMKQTSRFEKNVDETYTEKFDVKGMLTALDLCEFILVLTIK